MKTIYWVILCVGSVVVVSVIVVLAGLLSFDAGYRQGFANSPALPFCPPEPLIMEGEKTNYEELIQGFLENVQSADITFQLDSRNETASLSIYLEYEVE